MEGGDYGAAYGEARHCGYCGVGLAAGESCSIPGCPAAAQAGQRGGRMDGARALAILAGQADDCGQRRDVAHAEERRRLAAGDVNNATDALRWLHDHAVAGVRHE